MAKLDIVVPVYNEAPNILPLLKRIDAACDRAALRYRVIFVDDRSSDGTATQIRKAAKTYPVLYLLKKGKPGKAFSIFEGVKKATTDMVCMIDGDLQYPPEAIPQMFAMTEKHGVVVARRKTYQGSKIRRFGSRALRYFIGSFLHNIHVDVQSGLKVFRRDLVKYIQNDDIGPWALDLPLLHVAKEFGYSIGEIEITFEERNAGHSKLNLFGPTMSIAVGAVKLKFREYEPEKILPELNNRMVGAGLIHKSKRFITHTTLPHWKSGIKVFTLWQKFIIFSLLGAVALGLLLSTLTTAIIVVGILSAVYFADVVFNFFLILKSLHSPPEINPTLAEVEALNDRKLPIYTVLCPLYKESHIIPQFLEAISKMDWPKSKLDVQLLLEEDDVESIEVVGKMKLPKYVRVVVVPDSQPKTKPKACNYGLSLAHGEYLVIYDAEDAPDPLQLKKAYIGFQIVGPKVKCLQAKLNYYNPNQNLLTRFFTAEYSLWFDVILTGLQSIGTTIPLGGTSNHFRTNDLLELQGWDPFNVTEDCDLGVRLFKSGYKTAIIDSTTLEEANSNTKNWIRQRSRWIKGYMQTYLLHMRNPYEFASKQGIHALVFQLTVGGKLAFILINPFLWLLTLAYFVVYAQVGAAIEAVYPSSVFYMAAVSLVFGNFMYIYYYMIGCAKKNHWGIIKWVYLIPVYWLMVSIAGYIALYQLIVKPHYWEKTIHGLHLKKKATAVVKETVVELAAHSVSQPLLDRSKFFIPVSGIFPYMGALQQKVKSLSLRKSLSMLSQEKYVGGILFIGATMTANVINMLTNAYLGSALTFEQFGVFSLLVSLLYLVHIPINALGSAVNYKAGYLLGKHKVNTLYYFWKYIRNRAIFIAVVASAFWLTLTPFFPKLFHLSTNMPFLTFTILIALGVVAAVDVGYITARLDFKSVAIIVLIQPVVRLLLAIGLSRFAPYATYLSITGGLASAYIAGRVLAQPKADELKQKYEFHLPREFFFASLISGISGIAFFSLDNLLVAHLLSPTEAGKYGVLGLFGKMIFFVGSLAASFLAPLVARAEGAGTNSKHIFRLTLLSVTLMTSLGYVVFALGVYWFGPMFFGVKISAIRDLLPLYGLGISAFTLSQVIASYHLVKKNYFFAGLGFLLAALEITFLFMFHDSLSQIVLVMTGIGFLYLFSFGFLHRFYIHLAAPLQNITDLIELLIGKLPLKNVEPGANRSRILIFNWRDTKHVWAGGAEIYIQQFAKELVELGHSVTVFCGNDGNSKRTEMIDGVRVIRRGGFYTVYIWAFLYYVLRLRKEVDVIIDSENGIPFLTPLYVWQKNIFLLVHHVHQEYFVAYVKFPLKQISLFIETILMPLIYDKATILTVSESSKQEILKLGLGTPSTISVINPGIETELFGPRTKTTYPSVVYVGRLKPYKHVDTAIKAIAKITKILPNVKLFIAGSGESEPNLRALVLELDLKNHVFFLGKVTDEEKAKVLAKSWVAVQPSMIEGWGITVIEANASGTPVVAANVSGLRDSTKDGVTGILVKPQDTAALETALLQLLENRSKRVRMSSAAIKWAKRFSWKNSIQTFEDLLQQQGNAETVREIKQHAISEA